MWFLNAEACILSLGKNNSFFAMLFSDSAIDFLCEAGDILGYLLGWNDVSMVELTCDGSRRGNVAEKAGLIYWESISGGRYFDKFSDVEGPSSWDLNFDEYS